MPPVTRRQAQRQGESENDDIDNPPATVPSTPVTVPSMPVTVSSMPVTVVPTPATPPTTPPSTPTEDSNDESSEENFREYTPDDMIYIEREPSPTRLLVIERLLVPGVPNLKKNPLCMICLHDFPQPTPDCPHPTVRIPCGHYFCRECITHWLQDPWFDTCPVCRKEVITYQPGTGLPEGEAENDAEQENAAPALTPNQARIAALEQAIFMNNEEIRLYNNYLREAQQAPGTRAPLRDITAMGEFHERPNEENRRVPLGELTNGIPTFSRATTLQDLTTRDAQRAQAIRDADRARANRATRIERMSSLFQASNGGGPIRGRHPLQAVTNASPARSLLDVDEETPDVQPQQRGRTPFQTTRVRPSTPPARSRFGRSRSPVHDLTNPRTYRSRRAPIQLPQLLRPGQTRALTLSDHGRGDGGRRISIRSTATALSVYTLAPSEPLSTGETVFTLAPELPLAAAENDNDAMLRSDVRPGFFDAEAMIPDRFSRGDDPDFESDSDDDGSDAETAGRRTPRPAASSPGVRRLLWSRTGSPTPIPRAAAIPGAANLNATWTPLQGYSTTVHIDVARLRSQRALLLNAIRFAGRGQAEEAFRAMLRVAEASDGRDVAVDPLFRAMAQAGHDELVALARTQASGVVNRMNSPLRRRRIFEAGGVVGLRPEIVDAVRRLARRMVNLLRG